MEVFDTSHRFYVCVNISLQSLYDRYTGNMERFLWNKWSSCTQVHAPCLVDLLPVPAGQGAAPARAENTHVCEWTHVSKPALPSRPACVRSAFQLLVRTQQCSWSRFTENFLPGCVVLYGNTKAECKSAMYPCLLARDSASYKLVLRTFATIESFYFDPKITPRCCTIICCWNQSVLDGDSDSVKGDHRF